MTTKLCLLPEEKYFPLDLDSILRVGVEQWQKEFFWPISWVDFLKLEDKICDLLDSYVKEHRSHFISDLILINYKIYIEYTNLIHEVIVINNLKLKKRLATSNNSHRYKQIAENHIPKSSWIKIPEITKKHWLKNKIQNARLLYRLTSFHSISNFFASKVYITDVSCSKLTIEYLRKRFPGRVRAKCFNEWLNASIKTTDNEKKEIDQFCRQIVDDVSKIAEEYSVFFNDKQLNYLLESTATLFQTTYNLLLQVKDSLKKCQPIHLFIGPNNSFFSRILSVAIRKTGGKVSAFKHGEPLAYNWKKIAWMELSLVDEYFEYSTQLAEVLKRTLITNPTANDNKPRIKTMSSPQLRKIWQKQKQIDPPTKIKRIMVIGNAYKETGHTCVTSFPLPVQFDLECRIINLLKKLQFKVVYKKHPDGLFRNKPFPYMDSDVEIVSDAFEDNLDKADAFLFYYTRTTTFGTALCTQKPIIVIDGEWEDIERELLEFLKKRCIFIKVGFNEKNLLELDENDLRCLVTYEPNRLNAELTERLLFN